jgi:hypothetical protein
MAKPQVLGTVPASRWEANCLFCGDALPDEGIGFIDHMSAKPGCHEAYDHWLEEIDHDHPGG